MKSWPQLSTLCSIGYMTAQTILNVNPHRHSKYKQESNKAIYPSFANKLKDTKYPYLASISESGL